MTTPRTMLCDFISTEHSTYNFDNDQHSAGFNVLQRGAPPFSVEFGRSRMAGMLAAADEEGFVSLINTNIPKDDRESNVHKWMCHRNAIFDQAFSDGDGLLATASGDQTIRVWNMSEDVPELSATLRGHKGSVKSVRFRPGSQHELVSGAREGSIVLWDTRVATTTPVGTVEVKPLNRRTSAHVRTTKATQKRAQAQGRGRGADSQQSVTSVLFVDSHVLASAGANDGTVKLWDLRKSWSSGPGGGAGAQPLKSFLSREARATGRPRGISALAVNATRSKLLASSTDHRIYMFDCVAPEREPVTFSGHSNSSFYVKSAFSPDGRFIVSGSSDFDVFVWDVQHPLLPPLRLRGHHGEVSDVAWCPTDMTKLASCSDDTTVRLWTMERELESRRLAARLEPTGTAAAAPSWLEPGSQSESDVLICQETMLQSSTSSPAMSVSWDRAVEECAAGREGGHGQRTPQGERLVLPLSSEDEGEEEEEAGAAGAPAVGAMRRIFGTVAAAPMGEPLAQMCGSPVLKQAKLSEFNFTPLRRTSGGKAEKREAKREAKRRDAAEDRGASGAASVPRDEEGGKGAGRELAGGGAGAAGGKKRKREEGGQRLREKGGAETRKGLGAADGGGAAGVRTRTRAGRAAKAAAER